MVILGVTDLALDTYYHFRLGIDSFQAYQLLNYPAYGLLVFLGRRFSPRDSWLKLLSGGLLGAVLFYLLTNTAAWFFNPFRNPEYTKTLTGWLIALTKGTSGYPETWEFFRNTLLSGGLFTGLFVGAMKLTSAPESAAEQEAPEKDDPVDEPEGVSPESTNATL